MAGNEIRDKLLIQMLFFIDLVEFFLQFDEHVELGFAHQLQYGIAGVLWGHFQSTADVSCDQLAEILVIAHRLVFLRRAVMQKQVVADA